jgi:hypothetical protein
MNEAKLRELLTAIRDLSKLGAFPADERVSPAEGVLIVALGTIAGLATLALEGENLPPQRLAIDEKALAQLTAGEAVVRQTSLGYRVELKRRD